MKKLCISALCGLCLFGAFVSMAQPANSDDAAAELAMSRKRISVHI